MRTHLYKGIRSLRRLHSSSIEYLCGQTGLEELHKLNELLISKVLATDGEDAWKEISSALSGSIDY